MSARSVMDMKRIELAPDTDLRAIVERVHEDGTPRVIERDGEALAVIVSPDEFSRAAEARTRQRRDCLLSLAGVWSDDDADAMIEHVYRARHETPPSPPTGG